MGECLISRKGGESYKLPVLDDSYPQDLSLTVIEGNNTSANFNVNITTPGTPATYTYQWYVDGVKVSGANSSSYIITGLSSSATHTVYCEVTNKAGTVSSRIATLTVVEYTKPVLSANYPADVTIVESANGSATFKVSISTNGNPANYTYQWYVNDSVVSGATSSTYTKTGLTSEGVYTVYCSVTNAAGTVTSRVSTLIVKSARPAYSFSGTHELIQDGTYDWRIKFKSSGTLTFSNTGNISGGIDVFCVGAGGGCPDSINYCGGGAGGYATTTTGVTLKEGTTYTITIGAGSTGKGGTTSAFGCTASGGNAASGLDGASGGTGGGGYGGHSGGAGGSNGSDGGNGYSYESPGTIQGIGGSGDGKSKYEFGGTSGTLYCGGGGGSTSNHTTDGSASVIAVGGNGGGGDGGVQSGANPTNGQANTGGGGGGRYTNGSSTGGSGIVVIRNHR